MKTYTIEQIRKYLLTQDSMGDILYNLSEENLDKANPGISHVKPWEDGGWDCPDSPTGYCDYNQPDGSYDEDCCRYCGEPDERK